VNVLSYLLNYDGPGLVTVRCRRCGKVSARVVETPDDGAVWVPAKRQSIVRLTAHVVYWTPTLRATCGHHVANVPTGRVVDAVEQARANGHNSFSA